MKRGFLLLIIAIAFLSFQIFITCAKPLESTTGPNPDPPNPIYIYDTIIFSDTVFVDDTTLTIDTLIIVDTILNTDTLLIIDTSFVLDTINIIDTIINTDTIFVNDSTIIIDTLIIIDTTVYYDTVTVTDTAVVVDTVIVTVPDTTGSQMLCAQLASNLKEIVWMFRNPDGAYHLEFSASNDQNKPPRLLNVYIDDELYQWDLDVSKEFIFDMDLNANTIVKISTTKPGAFGHEINICLTITPEE